MRAILPALGHMMDTRYVRAEKVMEVISLALVARMNVILFGPGGHAKSEVADDVGRMIQGASSGVVMFGEGMTEDKLWGGINLNKLNDPKDKRIEYYLERSFLDWDIAVFEEIFDAPVNVLMALKYVLTSGQYNSGWQQFPMKTFSIIAATNREPHEVASMGPSAQALIERFLQLRVEWEQYDVRDFSDLFSVVTHRATNLPKMSLQELLDYQERAKNMDIPHSVQDTLASLVGAAATKGINISPRTAVLCLRLLRASAAIKERDKVAIDDIMAIQYLPGCDDLTSSMAQDLKDAADRAKASEIIDKYLANYRELEAASHTIKQTPISLLQHKKRIRMEIQALMRERVPESVVGTRDNLLEALTVLANNLGEKAEETVRLA